MNANSTSSRSYLFTSESVSEGHPDKIADQISDVILDAFLTRDPNARVACETVLANQFVLVAGEFKTADKSVFEAVQRDAERLVRLTLREIGYTSMADGIDPDQCEIRIAFNHQSLHISQGVDRADGEMGAGDQGLMFGYACDETPELMPLAISLAHRLVQRQAERRKSGLLPWLRPDAKSQVSVRYIDGQPVAVEKVVLSTQHAPDISTDELREIVRREIVDPVIPESLRGEGYEVLINPTGRFEIGGPNGDTGLTGRKIIVDSYGGSCPHGGGAFSGKDPSKVDRSAAYMARYIAKNIVAAGLARRCTIQLAYAIGVVAPVSVFVDTHGTGIVDDDTLEGSVKATFDLTPRGIMDALSLRRPIYRGTAAYGHFGRELPAFTWERTDRVDALTQALGITRREESPPPKVTHIRIGTWHTSKLREANRLACEAGLPQLLPDPQDDENNYWADVITDGGHYFYRVGETQVEISRYEYGYVLSNPNLYYFSQALKVHIRLLKARQDAAAQVKVEDFMSDLGASYSLNAAPDSE